MPSSSETAPDDTVPDDTGPVVPSADPSRTLYVDTGGAIVRKRGGRIVVEKPDGDDREEVLALPAVDIERVVLVGRACCTRAAQRFFLERGIDTTFLSWNGRLEGHLQAAGSPSPGRSPVPNSQTSARSSAATPGAAPPHLLMRGLTTWMRYSAASRPATIWMRCGAWRDRPPAATSTPGGRSSSAAMRKTARETQLPELTLRSFLLPGRDMSRFAAGSATMLQSARSAARPTVRASILSARSAASLPSPPFRQCG